MIFLRTKNDLFYKNFNYFNDSEEINDDFIKKLFKIIDAIAGGDAIVLIFILIYLFTLNITYLVLMSTYILRCP